MNDQLCTEYSGLTDRELFKLNGTLSAERIEALLDRVDEIEQAEEADIMEEVETAISVLRDELDSLEQRLGLEKGGRP